MNHLFGKWNIFNYFLLSPKVGIKTPKLGIKKLLNNVVSHSLSTHYICIVVTLCF